MMNRRDVLTGAGALGLCTVLPALRAQGIAVAQLADKLAVVDAGGANVVVYAAPDGLILVDSGAPNSGSALNAALRGLGSGGRVTTLLNTHYHLDQTGNNETLAAAGAKILAQERTKQWMSTDIYNPEQDQYVKARPKAARPAEAFLIRGSMQASTEQIDFGHLPMAHTSGDAYYFFKSANVIAVGDVAAPSRDPELDWFTGAWIGGRVDAMDIILNLANDQTKIVPGYGPFMTRAQFKAERDLMEEVRARLFKQVREGDGPKDMQDGGLLKELPRTWNDEYKFLYAACKGLWAHHDKLDANVV